MNDPVVGGVLGAGVGAGLLLVATRVRTIRRPPLAEQVLPYLRDLPAPTAAAPEAGVRRGSLTVLGDLVDRALGGRASVRRRLDRAGLSTTVHEFRIEQVVWGLVAFGAAALPAALVALRQPDRGPALFLASVLAGVLGLLLRDNRLTVQVAQRERRVLEELPVVAELLALAVAAGESPAAAIDRVVRRSNGALAEDLRDLLARARTGMPLTQALDRLASRSGLAPVTRFASGLAVAIERGTPLADVLHAQAGDVREAARRSLIESGARREVLMMVPVVFLVLPTVVVFAFWPGLVGLRLVV